MLRKVPVRLDGLSARKPVDPKRYARAAHQKQARSDSCNPEGL